MKILNFKYRFLNLCKIGALTNKPYKFINRFWELNSFFSLDFSNNLLKEVIYSFNLNEYIFKIQSFKFWITNNVRFGADGLRFKLKLTDSSFDKKVKKFGLYFLFVFLSKKLFKWSYSFNLFLNEGLDLESIYIIKNFFNNIGSSFINFRVFGDYSYNNNLLNNDFINYYYFKLNLNKFSEMDRIIFVGLDPRVENPLLNLEFRKIYLKNKNSKIFYSFGNVLNTIYKVDVLGVDIRSLYSFIQGKHKFCNKFVKVLRPFFFIGTSFLNNRFNQKIILNFETLIKYNQLIYESEDNIIYWKGLDILNLSNLDIGSRELGLTNKVNLKIYKNNIFFLFNNNIFNKKQLIKLFKNNLINKRFRPIIIYFGSYNKFIFKNLLVLNFNMKNIIEDSGVFLTMDGFIKKNKRNVELKVSDSFVLLNKVYEENSYLFLFICFIKFFFKYNYVNNIFNKLFLRFSGFLNLNVNNISFDKNIIRDLFRDILILKYHYLIFGLENNISYIRNNILNEYMFNNLYVKKFNNSLNDIHRHSKILLENFYVKKSIKVKFLI